MGTRRSRPAEGLPSHDSGNSEAVPHWQGMKTARPARAKQVPKATAPTGAQRANTNDAVIWQPDTLQLAVVKKWREFYDKVYSRDAK